MSFAALRQSALQAGALSSGLFAELVQISVMGVPQTVRAKLTLAAVNDAQGRLVGATGIFPTGATTDESERLAVCVSRDPTFALALVETPRIGDTLLRDAAVDSDGRPFVFKGEIQFQGDQHAVYTFERPRRFAQGKR